MSADFRKKAVELAQSRPRVEVNLPGNKISDFYGNNVFDKEKMKEHLSPETYKKLISVIEKGDKIDSELADAVATAMKPWAISKGIAVSPKGRIHSDVYEAFRNREIAN